MKKFIPKYEVNYAPGWDIFEKNKDSIISDIINDIEEIGSPDIITKDFIPSHVFKIINKTIGIEASTEGITYFKLSKYFNDESCELISYKPFGLIQPSINQMLAISEKLVKEKLGYDYLGLAGDTIEGILGLDELIPELKKIADPLHSDHNLFCSALVSAINKNTTQYKDVQLFKDYTISKISPLLLMMKFPYI